MRQTEVIQIVYKLIVVLHIFYMLNGFYIDETYFEHDILKYDHKVT